jgi:outer membrane protein OmpA-like peptidoglycan-associated protein
MKYAFIFLLMITCSAVFAQDYKIKDGEVKTEKQVSFKGNTADLLPESNDVLAIIKQYLDDKSYISTLRIEVNVAASGNAKADELLSVQRVTAVYAKLVSLGADCKRLAVVTFGSSKPAADGSTPEGRAANSYIKFVNAAIRGHLIGGMPADGGGRLIPFDCN